MIQPLIDRLDAAAAPVIGTLMRVTFAATLASYFWASAVTKIDGVGLSINGYAQILPRAMEAVNYDAAQLGVFHAGVVAAGTAAEFVLPALILLGLLTRPAALAMIGFVVVQTLTDLIGHGALGQPETLGALFDRVPDSPILDQRLLWVTLLAALVLTGPGPLSLDRLFARRIARTGRQSQTARVV
ncbi:MAG: DoxX family membrane protein [Pseudomonadota bacterium]|nr:DoxX family membrane protein [Pseudomonadota bacterium]